MAGLDEDGARACVDYSLIELARTGTTTVAADGRPRGVRRRRDRGQRAAGVRRADVPLGPVAHPGREAGRLRVGRRRRPARASRRRRRSSSAARARGRTGAGLPGAGPGRHLQRGAAARLEGRRRRPRRPDLPARVAGRLGVPGDDAAARPHAGRMALRHRLPRSADRPRSCDLHQRQLVGELRRRRPRPARGVGNVGVLQRLVLHPARAGDGVVPRLRRGRGEHVPGHRHRTAVDDRVAALDRDRRQGRGAAYRRLDGAAGLRRGDRERRRPARPAGPRADRGRARRPTCCSGAPTGSR